MAEAAIFQGLSWNLVEDLRQLFSYAFMVNALEAGTIVAVGDCGGRGEEELDEGRAGAVVEERVSMAQASVIKAGADERRVPMQPERRAELVGEPAEGGKAAMGQVVVVVHPARRGMADHQDRALPATWTQCGHDSAHPHGSLRKLKLAIVVAGRAAEAHHAQPQLLVDPGRGSLDQGVGVDQADRRRDPADREVEHRALGLRPVVGVGGHGQLAHGVALDPSLSPVGHQDPPCRPQNSQIRRTSAPGSGCSAGVLVVDWA